MVDREEIIGYITNNHPCEENMCPDSGMCRECAEKLLKEYENNIRADTVDECIKVIRKADVDIEPSENIIIKAIEQLKEQKNG